MVIGETYKVDSEDVQSGKAIKKGPYYAGLKSILLKKFSDKPDPEGRVRKIEENATDIFQKILVEQNKAQSQKNLLLVGKVQSGKTSNMEMAVSLAFDNGYNTLILFGGYDSVLLGQAIKRFKKAFDADDNSEDSGAHLFSTSDKGDLMALDDETLESFFEVNGKIIIVAMKKPSHLRRINDFLGRIDTSKIKALIFDDEGDQASLNTEYKQKRKSPTYETITGMKKLLGYPPYLSVTATPQALIFSPFMSELFPNQLQLIHPGDGYDGMEEFHLKEDHIVEVDDDLNETLDNGRISQSLTDAIGCYFVASAIMLKRGINKSQMIIHFNRSTSAHKSLYDLVNSVYIAALKREISYSDSLNPVRMNHLKEIFENPLYFSDAVRAEYSFDSLIDNILVVIKKVWVVLQDSIGHETMSLLEHKHFQIRIGADLLQRGVSFDQLVITYFTRWPKTKSNMDTSIQRARWLGYRSDFIDLCKVFCTQDIAYKFSKLAESEDDLWEQMEMVETGQKQLKDILIEDDESLGLKPSRSSVISVKTLVFGRRWLNQSIGVNNPSVCAKNNAAFDEIFRNHHWVATLAGSLCGEATAYHSEVTKKELHDFLQKTEGIFDHPPFSSSNSLMKAIATATKIDVLIFFEPARGDVTDVSDRFRKDIRKRNFSFLENGWRISALQQGANTTDPAKLRYEGDSKVIADPEALSIQVFPILPCEHPNGDKTKTVKLSDRFQFMYSVHSPEQMVVYSHGDE